MTTTTAVRTRTPSPGCPAEHPTFVDHDLELPTGELRPARDFGGQRFVRYDPSTGSAQPWRWPGFEARELGLAAATSGLAAVRSIRSSATLPGVLRAHDGELAFAFVARGSVVLELEGMPDHHLAPGAACAVPAGLGHAFSGASRDLELLEVTLPGEL